MRFSVATHSAVKLFPMQNTPRYLPQDANYLGTLKSKLGDLQGIETLVYELIQNADDVRNDDGGAGATRMRFDITDAALIVENDGLFRPKDFQRLTEVLHGGKSAETSTTGAFGVGFVAVYQVTDSPQIRSSGQQWTIRPAAAREQRIEIYDDIETTGTKFVLPWALDADSAARQALGAAALSPEEIATFPTRIVAAVRKAALFLTQLTTLEVAYNGQSILTLERLLADEQLELNDGRETVIWHLYQADFTKSAATLQSQHPQIQAARASGVTVAICDSAQADQVLYATLPSDTAAPLPVSINASFYPTTDRKQIRFDSDFRGLWNRAALAAAATALGDAVGTLPQRMGAARWSGLLSQLWAAREDDVWAVFWQRLAPVLRTHAVVQLVTGEWVMPSEAVLAMSAAEISAETLLAAAGISMTHPNMQPAHAALLELGAAPLTLKQIADCDGFSNGQPASELPAFRKSGSSEADLANWQLLWAAVEEIVRDPLRERDRHLLPTLALAWSSDGLLKPLRRLWRGDGATAAIFPDVAWLDAALHEVPFVRSNVARFEVDEALDHLELLGNETLVSRWHERRLDPPAVLDWFAQRGHDVSRANRAERLQRVALVPMGGDLRSLGGLFMPADFHDPLALIVSTDDAASQGNIIPQSLLDNPSIRPLLHRLDVPELTFETWLTQRLPSALAKVNQLPSYAVWDVIHMLARRLGELRSMWVEESLRKLPLIACLDSQFRAADGVYFDTPLVRQTLTTRAHLAETPDEAVAALYRWLGVRAAPDWEDALAALHRISDSAGYPGVLGDEEIAAVHACWGLIGEAFDAGLVSAEIEDLEDDLLIPNADKVLSAPNTLFFSDQAHLHQQFAEPLHEQLIPRLPQSWRVMQAAGVQRLSAVVAAHLDPRMTAVDADEVSERLRTRLPLIERVVAANRQPIALTLLESLDCQEATPLTVSYHLETANQSTSTTPHAAQALYVEDSETLFVAPEPAWDAIARELARALSPEVAAGGLATGIYVVLAAADLDEASRTLDALGF